MKMIYAIVSNDDSNNVSAALMDSGFSATRLATTGGFLRTGNTTFIICTEDDKVDSVIDIIAKYSRKRTQVVPSPSYGMGSSLTQMPLEITVGGATIFVTNIERYEKV